ncbi:MAG TPA: peptidylprolyl isomerase [Acidimicrobiia bacterium]
MSRLAMIAVALTLLAGGCGESAAPTTTRPPPDTVPEIPLIPSDYDEFRARTTACGAEAPAAVERMTFSSPDDMGIPLESHPTATIATSCGEIVVELNPSLAPATVNSFVFLASRGYFDGTVSHRIVPGFIMQGGDPTATGLGGPGYSIPDEYPSPDFTYERGVVAMANAGAGTTGSQFFIMLDDAGLTLSYSIFGKVIAGEDVLAVIAQIPLAPNVQGETSVPLETLYIEAVTIDGS